MKVYEIKMRDFLKDKVQQPIRGKRDIILLLLETIKMFGNPEGSKLDVEGKIMICIDKMSRVFYETQDKYFSFLFPFSL